jgi:hypothetical protein
MIKKPRGRPIKSEIRQNLIEILYFKKKAYGYELHKIYNEIFPKCTNEVVYYHLKKGTTLNQFKVEKIVTESGNYSWGTAAEKTYYMLGESAAPVLHPAVKEYFDMKEAQDNQKESSF